MTARARAIYRPIEQCTQGKPEMRRWLAIQVLVCRKIARGLPERLVVPRGLDQPGFNIGGAFSGSGTITCAVRPLGGGARLGYATELTFGAVQALLVVAVLPYPNPDGTRADAVFAHQIGVTSFTQPGDSGALVLDEAGAAVGMHIGGFDGMSLCTPMQRVLDPVGCRLA